MPSRSRVTRRTNRPASVRQYAAAKVNRLTGDWVPVDQSINDLIATSAPQVRARVRQLVRDFPFFTRAVDVLVDTTVGTGIEFQSRVRLQNSRKYNYPVVNAIEDAFARWADEADCAGRLHFHELTRLSDRNDLESGEHLFVRRKLTDPSRYISLAIQAVEPDRLTSLGTKPAFGNEVEQGVEFEPNTGRAVAYHLQDQGYHSHVRRILAEDVIHGFKPLRPDQLRGISPFASAVLVARDLDQFLGATIDTAKLASKYLAMVETADPVGFQHLRTETDESGKRIESLENAIIEYLRPGEKITFANHQIPNGQFDPFTKFILRMVAVATGTSYELLSGDYSGLTFSNLKAIRADMVRGIKPRADRRIRHFCKPVFRWFLQDASLRGRLNIPGLLADPWRFERCVWVWPGMESPDRLRDTKADIEEINNGLRSPQEVAAARGRDLEEILDEIEEAKLMREDRGIQTTAEVQNMKNNPAALGADEGDRTARIIPMRPKTTERRTRSAADQHLTTRATSLAPATLDKDNRSIEAVMASEAPVMIYSWDVGRVDEVLLMSGAKWPKSGKVPLLDTHDRYSSQSVLGSVSNIRVEGDTLAGTVRFSSTAEPVLIKVEEGHLTDFSVGYTAEKAIFVEEGKTRAIKGKDYTGPVLVTTQWRVKELSICPIGADENAKARAEADYIKKHQSTEEEIMPKELLEMLQARGLAPDATDEQARAFLQKLLTEGDAETKRSLETAQADSVRMERERAGDIIALGKRFGMDDAATKAVAEGTELDKFRQVVLEEFDKRQDQKETPSFKVEMGPTDAEKYRNAASDSLAMRGGLSLDKPAPGADDLMGYSMREIAREMLLRSGQRAPSNPLEMVGRALTTSDFPLILANVANKFLFAGFEGAEETWGQWCGTASASDFKTLHFPRVSEMDDLDEIPEAAEYKYGKRTEAEEQVKLATYGKLLAITRQAIINDDLNALQDVPRAHGEAAARKVGDLPYAVLAANPKMGDNVDLFHADHANKATNAALAVTSLAEGIKLMKLQKDLQGKRRLNIRPMFFLAPVAIEGTAEQFFRTGEIGGEANQPNLVNPYAGTYLTRIYEPRIDDIAATVWFLAGQKGKTITLFFLNGVQTPYLETKQGWNVDGIEYKVRIDAAAKAVDWRAMFRNDAA